MGQWLRRNNQEADSILTVDELASKFSTLLESKCSLRVSENTSSRLAFIIITSVIRCHRPALALATSSVQYSNARGREKERYTKVERRRAQESKSVDPKHMRVVFLLCSEVNSIMNTIQKPDANKTVVPIYTAVLLRDWGGTETSVGAQLSAPIEINERGASRGPSDSIVAGCLVRILLLSKSRLRERFRRSRDTCRRTIYYRVSAAARPA
ncbi:hypothetical protein EVAR_83506_1 [Eumeta japonica]|uniref:Uncharacterized protein n=1 Tax=Eumeta variegata TaxID=151549 RepID=A0A4C1Y062_EUMVA|nr:hypothetical protein EVAR_83506_1 [Eumeta japonica]